MTIFDRVEIRMGCHMMLSRDGPRGHQNIVNGCYLYHGVFFDNLDPFPGVMKCGLIAFGAPRQ